MLLQVPHEPDPVVKVLIDLRGQWGAARSVEEIFEMTKESSSSSYNDDQSEQITNDLVPVLDICTVFGNNCYLNFTLILCINLLTTETL